MYNTYYLKFASQEEWDTKAAEAGYRYEDPETGAVYYSVSPGAIDVVGTIYNDDAVYDEEGEMTSAPTAKDGWHVNVRVRAEYESFEDPSAPMGYSGKDVSLPEVLNNYIVEPQTPSRVFA
jgi:hypothetical protein